MKSIHARLFVFIALGFSSGANAEGITFNARDLAKMRPTEFLEYLRSHCCEMVTVLDSPKNWVSQKDVEELKKFAGDSRPAAPVYNLLSSHLCVSSTVKREAEYLIKGFREKRYPPGLCSTD